MSIMLAWFFGIGGIICNFLIYQQKSRKNLLTVKLIANCTWTIHYVFLSAFSGAAVCAIGMIREFVFLNDSKKWARGK